MYIRVPTDDIIFIDALEKIANILTSEEFKTKHLGKKPNRYTYVPLVKKITSESPYSVKFKLDTGKRNHTNTKIIHKKDNVKEQIFCNTIDEVFMNIPKGSKLRLIFKPTIIWKQNDTLAKPFYGLSLKCLKIEVQPSDYKPTMNDMYKMGTL